MTESPYTPPDQTKVDIEDPRAIDYWSRTLEVTPERLKDAASKVGPLLEDIKTDLGSYGVG